MNYELKIGWRYLYGGKRDKVMQLLALVALGGAVIGGVILALSNGANPVGVLTLVLSLISVAVFVLFSVFSVFTSVSVLGVVFGVAALTVVLAVTTGFQQQFRDKVLGVNAHVIVLKSQATFAEYRDVMKTSREIDPDVLAVQPFIFAEMLATRGKGELSGVAIKGIDPKLVRGVLDLDKHMIEGTLDSLLIEACPEGGPREPEPGKPRCLKDPPIIMGKELAHKLKAELGSTVTVVVPLSNIDYDTWRAKASAPRTR
ncbi:MAG: ABC transporter permease, partial [Kofleriaceae bacterium]